ncbi:hypothetical protein [Paenibacillus eucommiae]|uniref:Uncharacterized protein n=1 Tax=Paenibacillus eucommiae TaxID=1355755 RepID=A0ABS4ISE5_9BACL|nr:hypothetical protein [Paenibacillus eucommiae]MBP1990497.1 hypothetical protein [Paenibacillus eucommiae]
MRMKAIKMPTGERRFLLKRRKQDSKPARKPDNRYVSVKVLRKVALNMLPFYRKIACNRVFSVKWAKAVREADLDTMLKMFRSVVSVPLSSFATNAIGYFIDFPFSEPIGPYTNATSLRPGTTQFTFNSTIHQHIAKAILPLYTEIIRNPHYTALIVRAIRNNNQAFLDRLIRSKVITKRLISIDIDYSGMFLGFRYPASKFVYYNQFFRERIL